MKGKGLHRLICMMLAALTPALGASPAPAIGTVTAGDHIQIDGARVPSGAVLYSGDRVVTGTAGASVYLKRSKELALGASTDAQIESAGKGYTVRLEQGKIAVIHASDAPIIVNARGVTVESRRTNGSYEVSLSGDGLQVFTRRGATVVTAANRTVEVRAGSLMNAVVAPGQTPAKRSKISYVKWVTVAAAAAAIAGLGISYAGSNSTCVSPSQLTCP